MVARVVNKQLAGLEDLLLGSGTEEQERYSGTREITKINMLHFVASIDAVRSVDYTQFLHVQVESNTTANQYYFDPNATADDDGLEVLLPVTAPATGRWLRQAFNASGSYTRTTTESQVASAGQTVFTLRTIQYVKDLGSIQVHINGVYQNPDTYTEFSDGVTITFSSALEGGDAVDFTVGEVLGSAPTADLISYTPAGTGAVTTNVQDKLREFVSVKDFGADPANSAAVNTTAIESALESSAVNLWIDGTYQVNPMSVTLTADKVIRGGGTLVYAGAQDNDSRVLVVEAAGYSWDSDLSTDGNNLICSGVHVTTNAPSDLCSIKTSTHKNYLKTATGGAQNVGLRITGEFNTVEVIRNTFDTIGRESGSGVPFTTGTNGCFVTRSGLNYPKKIIHKENTYTGLFSNETGANDVDVDCFATFLPDPTNFPNGDATYNEYPECLIKSSGNVYINPVGRAEKHQSVPQCTSNKVIFNNGRTMAGGRSVLFAGQWGVGTFRDLEIQINEDNGISPFDNGFVPVGVYNGTNYNTQKSGCTIENITIENNVRTAEMAAIPVLIEATVGDGTIPLGLLKVSGISAPNIIANHILTLNSSTGTGTVILNDVDVGELSYSVVGAANACTNLNIHMSNIINRGADVDGFSDSGSAGLRTVRAAVRGYNLVGVSNQQANLLSGQANNRIPMLMGAILTGNSNAQAGTVTVQTADLEDEGTVTLDVHGATRGQHLFALSSNIGVGGLFFSAGPSGVITALTSAFASYFALGTGVDPDSAGDINLWIDADGKLNIHNKVGSQRNFTILFIG